MATTTPEYNLRPKDYRPVDEVRDRISYISRRAVRASSSLPELERDIHGLWALVLLLVQNLDPFCTDNDALVVLVLAAKERGILVHTPEIGASRQVEFKDGSKLWVDLPFLAHDVAEAWQQPWNTHSPVERYNLMAFVGRLVAVGACNEQLAGSALIYLRDVFETARPIAGRSSTKEADASSIETLIPPMRPLLQYCVSKLIVLCNASASLSSSTLYEVGDLARRAGVHSFGFSPARWSFWTQRLVDLCDSEAERVSKTAKACLSLMWKAEETCSGPLECKSFYGERWEALGLILHLPAEATAEDHREAGRRWDI